MFVYTHTHKYVCVHTYAHIYVYKGWLNSFPVFPNRHTSHEKRGSYEKKWHQLSWDSSWYIYLMNPSLASVTASIRGLGRSIKWFLSILDIDFIVFCFMDWLSSRLRSICISSTDSSRGGELILGGDMIIEILTHPFWSRLGLIRQRGILLVCVWASFAHTLYPRLQRPLLLI